MRIKYVLAAMLMAVVMLFTSHFACAQEAQEQAQEEQVFVMVQVMPSFPGGKEAQDAFIKANLKYPQSARNAGIEGRVLCEFIVNTDGSLADIHVKRGINPEMDQAAIEMLQAMPKWEPGRQGGKDVRVRMTLPVNFRL